MRFLFIFIIFVYCASTSFASDSLRVSVQIQPKQREIFESLFKQFTEETGIRVKSVIATDLEYKLMMPVWLLENKDTPDVMYWCASERLIQLCGKKYHSANYRALE